MSIKGFIRFVDERGATVYGELPPSTVKLEGRSVNVLSGDPFRGFQKGSVEAKIKKVCLESVPFRVRNSHSVALISN
jgi:hypothetical protein